jgi:hypothetical protein
MTKVEILDYLADGKGTPEQNAVDLIEMMFEYYLSIGWSKDSHKFYQLKKYLQAHIAQKDCD